MRLIRNADSAELWCGGRKVMEHTPKTPFLTAAEGSYAYRSSHGNFKVKEKIAKRIPLSLVGGDEGSLVFAAGDKRVEVKFAARFGGIPCPIRFLTYNKRTFS